LSVGYSDNLNGGAAGSLPYQTGSNTTGFIATSTNGYVLTLTAGLPGWAALPATGVTIVDDTTTNAVRYLTFTDATSGNITTENVSSTRLQFNPSTGALTSTSLTPTNALGATYGGTGLSSYTTGDLIYSSATNTLSNLAAGTNGYVLTMVAGLPAWAANTGGVTSFQTSLNGLTPSTSTTGAITLAGTLGAISGGTGQSTYTTGDILYASATNTLSKLAAGTNGFVLTLAAGVPSWASLPATGVSITNDTTTNSALYPLFTTATSGSVTTQYVSSTKYTYNPLLGTLSSPQISASNGIVVNSRTVAASYSIPSGSSAMSAGPITVASGQSVTVPSGSRWVVL
jgi:hypothetical protein